MTVRDRVAGNRPKKKHISEALAKMRMLLAAAALFVLIAGLTLQTYLVLYRTPDMQLMTLLFSFFFVSGVLLFAASAFINTEMVKAFLSTTGLLRSREQ